jgi:hypothetical protein
MSMKLKRNRLKQSKSLQERLLISAEKARQQARHLPPGKDREILLRKARQDEVTCSLADWLIPSEVSKP